MGSLNALMIVCSFVGAFKALSMEEVRIQKVSSLKEAVLIDRGSRDGIEAGMRAFFLERSDPTPPLVTKPNPKPNPRLKKAQARAVKIFEKGSVWFFPKGAPEFELEPGMNLGFLTEQKALRGWIPPRIVRHVRVSFPGEGRETMKRGHGYMEIPFPKREREGEPKRRREKHLLETAQWSLEKGGEVFVMEAEKQGATTERIEEWARRERHLEMAQYLSIPKEREKGEERK
ncbi:MAG: hypothetical protein OXB88_07640 [Bacteriovoracales bacterium]|nr:hypothetical protein [Bacteriovoracales bacterium]